MKERIEDEFKKIDTLLQDAGFALTMAAALEAAYRDNMGQPTTAFINAAEQNSVIIKSVKEEKIATNLAGFYALECGLCTLVAQTNEAPVSLLEKIVSRNIDATDLFLLMRFANTTWKAGQPFRELNRITRENFIAASHLSEEDIEKDKVQIINAATKLLASMKEVAQQDVQAQMEKLRTLLQDTNYAIEIAAWLHDCYYTGQNQEPPPFLTPDDDIATITKLVKEIKIATSIAGFYGLEGGVNFFVSSKKILPSVILRSLVNNSISREDEMLFARFANAAWKAGQPFIDLSRISRDTFTPFYFLSEADIKKDLAQLKKAAEVVLTQLEQ
ncbi:MAG: hypothetical protein ABIN67_23800 [Ferruginibacter sp.]